MRLIDKVSSSSRETYSIFRGAAINLITYSNVNQPTNTASATSKKYSSSRKKKDLMRFCSTFWYKRTYHSIFIFLLKSWKGREYKAQCWDDHKEAGDHSYNLEIFHSTSLSKLDGWDTFAAQEWWGFSNRFHRCFCVLEKNPVPKSSSASSWELRKE